MRAWGVREVPGIARRGAADDGAVFALDFVAEAFEAAPEPEEEAGEGDDGEAGDGDAGDGAATELVGRGARGGGGGSGGQGG